MALHVCSTWIVHPALRGLQQHMSTAQPLPELQAPCPYRLKASGAVLDNMDKAGVAGSTARTTNNNADAPNARTGQEMLTHGEPEHGAESQHDRHLPSSHPHTQKPHLATGPSHQPHTQEQQCS